MARFEITGPDGKRYEITAPEGANEQEALSFFQGQMRAPKSEPAPDPLKGMSTGDRLLTGIGQGFTRAGRAVKQAIDIPATALERKFGGEGVSRALGMPTAQESAEGTQQAIDEAEKIDAPLLQTGAGRTGSIIGNIGVALPAAFLPGANTMAGAGLYGAGVSALTTPGNVGDRATAGAFGAAGGVAGKAAGDALGKSVGAYLTRIKTRGQQQATTNAVKDATIKDARQAGYVVPPTSAKEGFLNRTLESVGGKAQTQQAAAVKNQEVTNRLAMEALTDGLDPQIAQTIKGQPLTPDLLRSIRDGAGGVYDAMANTGTVLTDVPFRQQLNRIGQQARQITQDFPGVKASGAEETANLIKGLSVGKFDARSGVELVKNLRAEASTNLSFQASADPAKKALGKAQRAAADALDELLERHATRIGSPDLGKSLKEARTLIAKTYTVENSLNEATGNVVAKELAKQLDKGKPLSPKLATAAKFAGAFPKAAEEVRASPGISALDFFGSGAASFGTGNPMFMAGVAARPAVRSLVLSKPYQNALVNPSYVPGALQLGSMNALRTASRGGMPLGVVGLNEMLGADAE